MNTEPLARLRPIYTALAIPGLRRGSMIGLATLITICFAASSSFANSVSSVNPNDPIINLANTSGGDLNCNGSLCSLKALLAGEFALPTNQVGGAGAWAFVNDTGQTLSSLTLFYIGQLASNASITMGGQGSGDNFFQNCTLTTATDVVTSGSCSRSTANNPALPLQLTWNQGNKTGMPPDAMFSIRIASFAHAGADVGCIAGSLDFTFTPPGTCTPVQHEVPEPDASSLLLFGMGLVAGTGVLCRRLGLYFGTAP